MKINLNEKIKEIAGRPFHPIDVTKINDQIIRIALIKGEFPWHAHANEEELFYVIKGNLIIQMKAPYSNLSINEGELVVVPKGVAHSTKSDEGTYVLMFEPAVLKSKGD